MKDNDKWMADDNMSGDDLKMLAKNMGIDKKYPSVWDIFQFKYEKEFGRSLKKDLDIMDESMSEPYTGTSPSAVSYLNDFYLIKKTFKFLKE